MTAVATNHNPITNPTEADTLELWREIEAQAEKPITLSDFVSRVAVVRVGGTRHIGAKRHEANAKLLIRSGRLRFVSDVSQLHSAKTGTKCYTARNSGGQV